jgi:NAD-dependent DNA ligase
MYVLTEDELRAWHERLQQRLSKVSDGEEPFKGAWVVEPKVDGLALTLRYEGGKLVCAATRGDGSEGASQWNRMLLAMSHANSLLRDGISLFL